MFYFYTSKTSESQRFSDLFKVHRKQTLKWNGLRLQADIVDNQI